MMTMEPVVPRRVVTGATVLVTTMNSGLDADSHFKRDLRARVCERQNYNLNFGVLAYFMNE